MAQIAPFRGICFNPAQVTALDQVVSPPYDVINSTLQRTLSERSPYNVVRLILGVSSGEENDDTRYFRSASLFDQWQQQQVLCRDEHSAIYLYDQDYDGDNGERLTRKGFIALARLEEFASGMVKPHEQTRFDWCRDRLQLLRHCQANFSPVFSLYSDPCCVVESITGSVRKTDPDIAVQDDHGVDHRLWRITDRRLIATIQNVLDSKPLLIADGHHRYETALNYRDERREQQGEFSGKETYNYISMYFSNMEDPSCRSVSQPRVLTSLTVAEFLQKADEFFLSIPLESDGWTEALAAFDQPTDGSAPVLVYGDEEQRWSLQLRDPEGAAQRFRHLLSCAPSSTHLAILYRAVVESLLAGSQGDGVASVVPSAAEAIRCVDSGRAHGAIFVPALAISTIKDIANAGEKIPENSTCFYPSVLSGLVINPIVEGEQIGDFL
jgi:uncharacterized protein (DUF1015 family)